MGLTVLRDTGILLYMNTFKYLNSLMFATSHRKHALSQLQNLEKQYQSQSERFEVPFQFRGKGLFRKIAPRQNIDEIKALYENVCQLRPKRVLEIGTARGG